MCANFNKFEKLLKELQQKTEYENDKIMIEKRLYIPTKIV